MSEFYFIPGKRVSNKMTNLVIEFNNEKTRDKFIEWMKQEGERNYHDYVIDGTLENCYIVAEFIYPGHRRNQYSDVILTTYQTKQ
jgi:hypothetical protein